MVRVMDRVKIFMDYISAPHNALSKIRGAFYFMAASDDCRIPIYEDGRETTNTLRSIVAIFGYF